MKIWISVLAALAATSHRMARGKFPTVAFGMLALLITGSIAHAQALYVTYPGSDTVGECDASSGAAISSFTSPTGLNNPDGLAISGNDLYVASNSAVGEYNATTGEGFGAFKSPSVPGDPFGLAVSGNDLYVSNLSNFVGEYNATTGAAITPIGQSLISGLFQASGLVVSGNNLYVANWGPNGSTFTVGDYDATTGVTIAGFTTITTGLDYPEALAISGNDLYVSNEGSNTVREYNATTGAIISGFTSPTGLVNPGGIAVSGNDLYVQTGGTVAEYDATTGAAISGFNSFTGTDAFALAISPVPEPGTYALVIGGLVLLLGIRRSRLVLLRHRKPDVSTLE